MVGTMERVVVTGTSWMGAGIGSIESAIDDLFRTATDEIILSVYTIGSGADRVFRWLEGALNRGVQVSLVINALGDQPADVVRRLRDIDGKIPAFPALQLSG